MRPLTASRLLSVWERASRQPTVERALLLLSAACPESTTEELARLSIGQRDSLLLVLREWTFGPQFVGRVPCQKCREPLEVTFNVADVRIKSQEHPEALSLKDDGYEVQFRVPNSEDIGAVSGLVEADGAEHFLLQRCILRVRKDGAEALADDLPPEIVAAVVDRMAEADPQAEVQLTLACVACSHKWLVTFDVVSYFWSEVNAWANRMLREVHLLASTYGWREGDILAMSPWRRQSYLEMIGG